jgi:3',5'-cyclic AMP phosphodiesterase CpdA
MIGGVPHRQKMTFTLAHLSDIHLGPLPRPRSAELIGKRMLGYVNWQRRRRQYSRLFLDRLMADLALQRPDHIAITGDLVNLALPAEFLLAKAWLETIGNADTVTVVPGNHDAYVRLKADRGHRLWDDYMQSNWESAGLIFQPENGFPFVRQIGEVALIGLSSAVPTMPLMASGRLGSRQLATMGLILDALREQQVCRVILVHHPPLPGMSPWKSALHDASAARARLIAHGAELVLHGHAHRDSVTPLITPQGPLFVVGVASASSGFRRLGRVARYNLFTFLKTNTGWRIHMRSRSFGEDGLAVESDHGLLGAEAIS